MPGRAPLDYLNDKNTANDDQTGINNAKETAALQSTVEGAAQYDGDDNGR